MEEKMKKIIAGLFTIILTCTMITGNNIPIRNVQAASKATKVIKHAKNTYYTTRRNLKKYKKIRNSGCVDYWKKRNLRLTIVKPKKGEILTIKGTTCEYYYDSKQELVFAFAYKKVRGKVKEYRAYYSKGKCYRYIGPNKKAHTYKKGRDPEKVSKLVRALYNKGTHNLDLAGFTGDNM